MKYIRIIHVEIAKWKKKNNLFDKVIVLSSSEYKKWQSHSNKLEKIFNFIPMPLDKIPLESPHKSNLDETQKYNPYENIESLIHAKKTLLQQNIKIHNETIDTNINCCKIIAVGQMYSKQKGFPRMISAYSKIAKVLNNKCRLEITGKGHDETTINALIKSLNMQEYIKLKPFTTNIESVYLQGDIYAMTSYYEGLPMALIEAMSYGLPIIAYNIATIRDCFSTKSQTINGITYHENGILVPEGDEELLCKAIQELVNNRDMRLEMGRQSLILARDRFSKEVIMQEWQKLLEDITKH